MFPRLLNCTLECKVLFVHAGLLPEMLEHRSLEDLNVAFHAALKHASNSQRMQNDEPKLLGSHGPVWARDYAFGRHGVCKMAAQVLAKVEADKMVVGHTIQRDFHVHTRCDGQIVLGDTAISSVYGGTMSYMEHANGEVKVMYPGAEQSMVTLGKDSNVTAGPVQGVHMSATQDDFGVQTRVT